MLLLVAPAALTALTLLAPIAKESILSLFNSSTYTEAHIGHGILIGDAGTNVPFSTINWRISQIPTFGNTYRAVSIFVVPERVARRKLYPYRSSSDSGTYEKVTSKADSQSVGMRTYIYLLPKMYSHHRYEEEAKVAYHVTIKRDIESEPLGTTVYQFQDPNDFSDFIDMEPSAYQKAASCSCFLGAAIEQSCPQREEKCIEKVKQESVCPNSCFQNEPYFTSWTSSYNYFTIVVPQHFYFKYNVSILTYFYNHTMFNNNYKCIIRGSDSCSFPTTGFLKWTKLWEKRDVIIAYVQPSSVPGSFTTRLLVEAEIQIDYPAMLAFICAMCTAYLVLKYCRKMYKCYRGMAKV